MYNGLSLIIYIYQLPPQSCETVVTKMGEEMKPLSLKIKEDQRLSIASASFSRSPKARFKPVSSPIAMMKDKSPQSHSRRFCVTKDKKNEAGKRKFTVRWVEKDYETKEKETFPLLESEKMPNFPHLR
jgi:hypothetical protein